MQAPSNETSTLAEAVPTGGSAATPDERRALWGGHIRTEVSRRTALALTLAFLLPVFAVPLAQAALEKSRGDPPFVLELFRRSPTREGLREFEEDLEKNSDFKDYVQPRLQALLTRFGGAGNKKAAVSRSGFLFYVPGVEHVAGPGILDRGQIELRERAARDAGQTLHADPRPAIFALERALRQRGIELVLFPVPDKAMLQPRELHGRVGSGERVPVARNVDWFRFAEELRSHGVTLFDPAPKEIVAGEAPLFLTQDTHWTPRWMAAVAKRLAGAVRSTVSLPPLAAPPVYTVAPEQAERVGDVTDMLKLPEDQRVFSPERVTIEVVKDAAGNPWEPDPKADVLLLGDSFTNVFSMEFMGWGASAGLAPHLAVALGRPVDVIAQNDSGAFATRQALSVELAGGTDRLAGKRVVIWEFAVRELSVGDWKPFDYALGKEAP